MYPTDRLKIHSNGSLYKLNLFQSVFARSRQAVQGVKNMITEFISKENNCQRKRRKAERQNLWILGRTRDYQIHRIYTMGHEIQLCSKLLQALWSHVTYDSITTRSRKSDLLLLYTYFTTCIVMKIYFPMSSHVNLLNCRLVTKFILHKVLFHFK